MSVEFINIARSIVCRYLTFFGPVGVVKSEKVCQH